MWEWKEYGLNLRLFVFRGPPLGRVCFEFASVSVEVDLLIKMARESSFDLLGAVLGAVLVALSNGKSSHATSNPTCSISDTRPSLLRHYA